MRDLTLIEKLNQPTRKTSLSGILTELDIPSWAMPEVQRMLEQCSDGSGMLSPSIMTIVSERSESGITVLASDIWNLTGLYIYDLCPLSVIDA